MMRKKISSGLLALAACVALGATTVAAKDYGGGDGGGGESHQAGGGGGGGEKMHKEGNGGGGGGEKMRHEGRDGGGGERMRRHEEHGDMERHHRRGHWRGGIWIYDEGYGGGGYCYRWRHECADRWGWGGPGFRRCLRRHGC